MNRDKIADSCFSLAFPLGYLEQAAKHETGLSAAEVAELLPMLQKASELLRLELYGPKK